jgi:hypothetical protein
MCFHNLQLYALHDNDEELKKQGSFVVTRDDACKLNADGYGIFQTPNNFSDQIRRKDKLVRINYWIADIDCGTKEEQKKRVKDLCFHPSVIVETKKGYHCYWKAKDATVENYSTIEQGIIKKLDADRGCKDVTRLLRAPGFNHCKDKDNQFFVDIVYEKNAEYLEKEMLFEFRIIKKVSCVLNKYKPKEINKSDFTNPDNWNRLFQLERIREGSRNNELTRIVFWLRDVQLSSYDIEYVIRGVNQRINPLPDEEIRSILKGKI